MAEMSRRGRRKKKTRRKKRTSRNRSSTPTSLGVDFGCFRANAAVTFPEFSSHLGEASIVAVAYGSEWCEALRAEVPSMSLARISHTVTAEGFGGSVGAEFLPREQVEQKQAALRPCFRGARGAGTAA